MNRVIEKYFVSLKGFQRNFEQSFHSDVVDTFHKLASEQIVDCFLDQSSKQLHTLALPLKIHELKIPS